MIKFRKTAGWFAGLTCVLAGMLAPSTAFGQGCVISRGGGCSMVMGGEGFLAPKEWQVGLSYRWLHSDRHFLGRKEQPQRQALGTEVINDSHFFDLNTTYAVSKRFWLTLTVPFVYSERSSLYEHQNFGRFTTRAGGLGDIRFVPSYWMFNPETTHRGNLSLGAGVKAPTGEYRATDTFRTAEGGTIERSVDTSIQPGDGGWGVVLETQGFLHLIGNLSGYMNGSYLINPRESTSQLNPVQNARYGNLYSVPDSYLGRAGLEYAIWPAQGLSFSLGGRIEGVPPRDLIGGDLGRRRPGYAISIEPGVTWVRGRYLAAVTAPVALERNRQPDYGSLDGVRREGDSAFADFTINASFAVRF
jgi:hypothetical protein